VFDERVTAYDTPSRFGEIRFSQSPDLSRTTPAFSVLPYTGFSLPVVMRAYMSAVSLKNQRPHAL
jgi:hypothetical protein